MNPYASHLAGAAPLEVIQETPDKLSDLVKSLSHAQVTRAPAPGKWSVREILCHLADCEIVFAFRIRQTLAETEPVIQPFDQEAWARHYRAYDAGGALATFSMARLWNTSLLESLPAEAFARVVTHPERGAMTLQTVVETMAGHDLNHLKQVQNAAAALAGVD
jgi:uncharacterized damage-inducible protein DinB